jgi:hypothetical protein
MILRARASDSARSQAPLGDTLPRSSASQLGEAELPTHCVPKRSLGTRMQLLGVLVLGAAWTPAFAQRSSPADRAQSVDASQQRLRSDSSKTDDTETLPAVSDPVTFEYRVGMRITAVGPVRNLRAGCVVPMQWPEQRLRHLEEDNNLDVDVRYQELEGTVRQMLIAAPGLSRGQTIELIHTYEVTCYRQQPPAKPQELRIAEKLSAPLRGYLRPSPGIECNHRALRSLHKELALDGATPWDQVERYYEWTRENITYVLGGLKGARKTLKERSGDCEDLTSVFIALCRREGIPARTVWVPGHVWAEFYLVDPEGRGGWYPAELTGPREFGYRTGYAPILQKGERFRPAGTRATVRYVAPWARGDGVPPRLEFISEIIQRRETDPRAP